MATAASPAERGPGTRAVPGAGGVLRSARRGDGRGGTAAQRAGDERVPARGGARREIRARWEVTEDRVRVTVADADGALPGARTAGADDESGRGLALVAALADDWGAARRACGVGKEVWFLLVLPPAAGPSGGVGPGVRPGGGPWPSGSARGGWRAGAS
ncbi:ATP-binding protein [Streptomyces tropicalis]|uniref:ATP-binding protein n=1 Tax=Streptomyces tropicalis TaxID=3034234 RepID=UPI003F68B35B